MSRLGRTVPALAAALVLAACDNGKPPEFQGWMEANLIFVAPDEIGRIKELCVREGDQVEPPERKADRAEPPACERDRAKRPALLFKLDTELQEADLQMQQAALENAQQAYDRAITLLRTNAGTQKNVEDAEAALRTAKARLNSSRTRLDRRAVSSSVDGRVEQIYYRAGELVPAGRPVVALLPPGNLKVRFFVDEAHLSEVKFGGSINVQCDGCDQGLSAKISFIARNAEFTPPVIYSREERHKLVYLVEALPDQPQKLAVGQPVTVTLMPGNAQ